MAAEKPKPQVEILSTSFSELPGPDGKLRPYTHLVFKDELGLIGTITIEKKDPSEADIREAIKAQREAQKARKPTIITL